MTNHARSLLEFAERVGNRQAEKLRLLEEAYRSCRMTEFAVDTSSELLARSRESIARSMKLPLITVNEGAPRLIVSVDSKGQKST